MTVHYADESVTLHHGDCLDVMASLADASVDAVVTDPPYGLGFMGKAWDDLPPGEEWARECLRVLKPGGHLLAFGGTRTWHRLTVAVEDAGFEVRDSIAWLYGSGFPKSLDVSKAIDKRGGNPNLAATIGAAIKAARTSRGWTAGHADRHFCGGSTNWSWFEGRKGECRPPTPDTFARIVAEWPELAPLAEQVAEADREMIGTRTTGIGTGGGAVPVIGDGDRRITAPHTPAAERWQGWGTALKPAFEPIVVARKPPAGTVAGNVLAHGTGALNIDGCRVGTTVETWPSSRGPNTGGSMAGGVMARRDTGDAPAGRWPTNVVLDGHAADELDRQAPSAGAAAPASGPARTGPTASTAAYGARNGLDRPPSFHADAGGASRFFPTFRYEAKAPTAERPRDGGTAHPTVKPLDLIRWLVRLVTPPGGLVLDPFAGSGTTAEACVIEGARCVAVEREAAYLPLIVGRLSKPIPLDLFGLGEPG